MLLGSLNKELDLNMTYEANLKTVYFLDVTLNLSTERISLTTNQTKIFYKLMLTPTTHQTLQYIKVNK